MCLKNQRYRGGRRTGEREANTTEGVSLLVAGEGGGGGATKKVIVTGEREMKKGEKNFTTIFRSEKTFARFMSFPNKKALHDCDRRILSTLVTHQKKELQEKNGGEDVW